MDPSNLAGDADDLASYLLQAMRLGQQNVELMLEQRRHAALAPPPSPEQLDQHRGATSRHEALASPFQFRTMDPMMQALQTTRQFWPQTQPYYPSAQSGSQHQSDPWSSAPQQQQPCTLSASASQYQSGPWSSAQQEQPCTLSASASQYQPQAVATSNQYQKPDSSFYQRMRAIEAAQAQAVPTVRERRRRTLEETRSALLSGAPMELQLVTFPDSAAHVVHLLLGEEEEEEGAEDYDYERILQSVLAGVTRRVHDFIDHKEGHEVLVALLRACAGRHAEVDAIVQAALAPSPNGRNSLLRSTKHDYWENCVKELMTAASPYPDLRAMLLDRLLSEGLLEHDRADQLLDHCFATTHHEDTRIVVQCALNKIGSMIHKSSGSKCLVECYARATGHQLRAFNDILLARAAEIAKGKFSNYFMQHVLEHADGETRHLLVKRLMADVVTLSDDPIGSYVVEACYQKAGLLHLVLPAFLRLDDACLVKLVRGTSANYVVHKLLDTAIDRFPRETMGLARRIQGLPPADTNNAYAKKVMKVVWKILTRYGRMYA